MANLTRGLLFGALLLLAAAGAGCLGDSGVTMGLRVADYLVGRTMLSGLDAVTAQDLKDLEEGRLYDLRQRYEAVEPESLSDAQLSLLCDLYSNFNDFDATLQCLTRLEDRGRGDDRVLQAVLGRRALVYLQTGDYDSAARLSAGLSSDGGRYLNALANAHLGDEALARREALRFSRFEHPRQQYFATAIYMALDDHRRVLEIMTSPRTRLLNDYGLMPHTNRLGQTITPAVFRMDLFGEFNFGFFEGFSFAPRANVYVEFMAASAFALDGQDEEAYRRFSYLIDHVGPGAFRDVLWMSYYQRGLLREKRGDAGGAISDYRRAIELVEGIRSTIRSETGRVGFVGDKFSVYDHLIGLLLEKQAFGEALEVVERSKGRALVDMLSARSSFAVSAADQAEAPRLLERMVEAEANLINASAELDAAELAQRLAALTRARQALEEQAPALASLVTVRPVSVVELQEMLAPDEVALIFQQGAKSLYTFLLTREAVRAQATPLAGLLDEVALFRETLAEFDSDDYRPHAASLYSRLLGGLEDELFRHARLTIVPAGSLYYLPFAALLDDDGRFLMEKITLRVLPNLSIVPLLAQSVKGDERMLIYGNPDRGDPIMDLPGAEEEALVLASRTSKHSLYLREEATAVRFREVAGKYGYIHIASHGEFRSDDPLASRLLLAPAGEDSGDLRVNDLYGLRLASRLVVLSACETALSRISPGDEMIGLQRAFLYAGAEGLIGSLWAIADEATVTVMTAMYEKINQGYDAAEALRAAQQIGMREFPHPFFWAPFIYTGLAG